MPPHASLHSGRRGVQPNRTSSDGRMSQARKTNLIPIKIATSARFTSAAGHAQALGQQRRVFVVEPQEGDANEGHEPDAEDSALHPAPIARQP